MRGGTIGGALLFVLAAIVFVGFNAVFTVNQTEKALVLRFGEPIEPIREPGLNFKMPFVDSVVRIDQRILDLDLPAQEVIASDQKRLVVDAFARYRIANELLFYQRLNTIERANNQLATALNSSLRRVLGEASFEQVVRDQRTQLMAAIRDQMNREASSWGLTVVDVKIRRADLPQANSEAIYQRMNTERQREAAEIRAQGAEAAQRIRARADRDVTVLLANANRDAEKIRGEGDALRNQIFAEAYGRDPEFFAFYRSMLAYESGLAGDATRLVISPDSDFFRFFNAPGGVSAPAARPAPAAPAPADAAPAAQ